MVDFLSVERPTTIGVCHNVVARWQHRWLLLVARCGGTYIAAVMCAICSTTDGSDGQLERQPWCCDCAFRRAEIMTTYLGDSTTTVVSSV